jgi:hypothetical protein
MTLVVACDPRYENLPRLCPLYAVFSCYLSCHTTSNNHSEKAHGSKPWEIERKTMSRLKFRMLSCMFTAALITLVLTTQVAKAAPLNSGAWNLISSWSVGGGSSLDAVAAISTSDVWAVGWGGSSDSFTTATLTEHWDGMTWNLVPSANVKALDQKLYGVAAVSTNDVWAVGEHDNADGDHIQSLIEHWNGSNWSVVASPSGNHPLNAVAVISTNDVWAVGTSLNATTHNSKTLTEHWNGTSWSIVASPNVGTSINALSSIAVVSANDIWAVGEYGNSFSGPTKTLIEHWNGSSWSIVSSPNVGTGDNVLYGVSAISTSDVWAVGSRCLVSSCFNGGTEQTLIEQWNGTSWNLVSSPNVGTTSNILTSVTTVSTNNIWAVGYSCSVKLCFNRGLVHTLIEQWNGSSWSVVASPNFGTNDNYLLNAISVPGSTQAWAVGGYSDGEGDPHPLTELYY